MCAAICDYMDGAPDARTKCVAYSFHDPGEQIDLPQSYKNDGDRATVSAYDCWPQSKMKEICPGFLDIQAGT
eukprot:g4765.t1